MQNQRSDLAWREGQVPVSSRFDDSYFSLENGLAETRHVFLEGNGLPARFCDGFHVAELGFGTGLNFLATVQAWDGKGVLHFTSFEAYPLATGDMARALGAFPELATEADDLCRYWAGGRQGRYRDDIVLEVIEGDARKTLSAWGKQADAWYLDGFSPAKNPELWGAELMREVGACTASDGTFATYTAAGFVRRALSDAGFEVSRRPGFGRKRHMSVGTKG